MPFPIILFLLQCYFNFSSSVPISSNSDTNATVGWVSDPDGRGTMSLIISCVLTLTLCVWSAMHLNIPPAEETVLQTWIRNTKWLFMGIFCPELVLFTCWRQYNSAMVLAKELRALHQEVDATPHEMEADGLAKLASASHAQTNSVQRLVTMAHGFYAGMGGYTIEINSPTSENHRTYLPSTIRRLTLTALGVRLVAECGHLPDIPKRDILDKSKANGVAKLLLCLQALWMLIQVIVRLVAGLPVTLLEVNTVGHVFCALLIYILWWHKPQSIQEATRIDASNLEPIVAYMYMCSRISGHRIRYNGLLRKSWLKPEIKEIGYFAHTPSKTVTSSSNLDPIKPSAKIERSFSESTSTTLGSCNLDYSAHEPQGVFKRLLPASESASFEASEVESEARRWELAGIAMEQHPCIVARFLRANSRLDDSESWLASEQTQLVTKSAGNWPDDDLLRGVGGLVMGMVLWSATIAFGALHAAAWYDDFPSQVEAWMWRSSAVWIAFSGLVWLLVNLIARCFKSIDNYWNKVLSMDASWMSYVFFGTICSICGLAYIYARLFLVVEAFISCRRLPVDAYSTPQWTEIFPHL